MNQDEMKNKSDIILALDDNGYFPGLQQAMRQDVSDTIEESFDRIVEKYKNNLRQNIAAHTKELLEKDLECWNDILLELGYFVRELETGPLNIEDRSSIESADITAYTLLRGRVTQTWKGNKWTSLREVGVLDQQLQLFGMTRRDALTTQTLPCILKAWNSYEFGTLTEEYCDKLSPEDIKI